MSRLRACWAIDGPVGWAVMPRMCTRRVWISIRVARSQPTPAAQQIESCRERADPPTARS